VVQSLPGCWFHPTGSSWEIKTDALFSGDETLVSLIVAARPAGLNRGYCAPALSTGLTGKTSGVMVIAKTPRAQDKMIALFQHRKVAKVYDGLVCGEVKDDRGIIDVPIGRVTGGKLKASAMGRGCADAIQGD